MDRNRWPVWKIVNQVQDEGKLLVEVMLNDNQIVELFSRDPDGALSEVVKRYGEPMRRIAVSILTDERDAEECVNDTYLAACKKIPIAKPANLRAYLFRMIRNFAFERLRHDHAKKRGGEAVVTSFEELSECIPDRRRAESADETRLREQMEEFLRQLTKERRAIFLGRFWFMYSVSEIAAQMGKDEKYISNQLYNMKKKLKKYLKRKD